MVKYSLDMQIVTLFNSQVKTNQSFALCSSSKKLCSGMLFRLAII